MLSQTPGIFLSLFLCCVSPRFCPHTRDHDFVFETAVASPPSPHPRQTDTDSRRYTLPLLLEQADTLLEITNIVSLAHSNATTNAANGVP